MADVRINALATTATTSASDDYLAIDGSANGTRKLSAYSPTFGGTVTDSAAGPSLGTGVNTQNFLASAGSGFVGYSLRRTDDTNGGWLIGTSAAVVGDFAIYQNQGASTVPVQRLLIGTTGNATLAGNLTVSGTGTSSVAGPFSVGSASGSTGQNSITFPKIAGGSYANAFYLYSGNTDQGFGFSLYDITASAWRWTMTNTGNLLLGTTTDNTYKLQVNGPVYSSSNIASDAAFRTLAASSFPGAVSTNGLSYYFGSSVGGAVFYGKGSTYDVSICNKDGSNVMSIPTGTTDATFAGAISIGNTVQTAVAVASTHKVTISIGGTTYYLLATNV